MNARIQKAIERGITINLIVLVLVGIVHTCLSQPAQEAVKPGRPLDLRTMQMQQAVLTTRDIHKVEELLKQGVDINAPIGCGTYSALDGAVTTENLEMLKFLLAHGAKPQGRELADAAFIGNTQTALELAKALLAAGVDVNATNRYSTPLTSAAYQDNRDLVALLLAQPRINVNLQDVDGYTGLMWASEHGSLELVNLLVSAGANPNIKNKRGETALTLAEQGIATRRMIISKLESKR
jgi:ankyrin repeat protein